MQGQERLIVILGMAHSGTTLLTYILSQHPDIACYVGGPEDWVLENDWLPYEDADTIQKILNSNPKRILLKRPWSIHRHFEWTVSKLRNAMFIDCVRNFEEISESWSKPNSMVGDQLRNWPKEQQLKFYLRSMKVSQTFSVLVPNVRTHNHSSFLLDPTQIHDLVAWLNLPPFDFDFSSIGGTHVKTMLRENIPERFLRFEDGS